MPSDWVWAFALGFVCFPPYGLTNRGLQAAKHPNAKQESFFELKVRPLLVARCFRCHGEKLQKGGIRLDSAEAILGKSNDERARKTRPSRREPSH